METDKPISRTHQVTWGAISAIAVSFIAYLASQIIVIILLVAVDLLNGDVDISKVLEGSNWLTLALSGVSSGILLLVLYWFLRHRKASFKNLGFSQFKISHIGWIAIGLIAYFGLLFVALSAASLVPGFDVDQAQNIGYQSASGWQLVLAFVGLVILPPLAEEMIFRGFLYRGLATKWPKSLSALMASGLFAVAHLQWNVGVDVFVLSMVMIALYEKTKNLWACIALHSIKNAIAFAAIFVFANH